MASLAFLICVVAPFMLIEALRSSSNERGLRRRGAIEPVDDVYPVMSVVYPASFIAMALEGVWWGGPRQPWVLSGLAVFVLGKLVKFWAIAVLGDRWSFKVLVLPGAPLIAGGPYRFIRHPNYVGVMGELLGTAIFMPAPVTGTVAVVAFAWILWRRIAVEERALGLRT